jgi:hypothetical protein
VTILCRERANWQLLTRILPLNEVKWYMQLPDRVDRASV